MINRNNKSLQYDFNEYLVLTKYNDKVTHEHCMYISNFHVFYTLPIGVLNIVYI